MKITRSVKIAFTALALTLGLALGCLGAVGEKVEWNTVPPAVQATIKTKAGEKTVSTVEKKLKGGKTSYAATAKGADGKEVLITVDADGKLLNVKENAPIKDVPAAVQAAIKTAAGDKTVSGIQKKMKGKKATYIATAKGADGKAVLISVDADGKVLKTADAK
jgi:uncharacterized membrane protein YkoI